MFDRLRNTYAQWMHRLHLRRQGMQDAMLRFRQDEPRDMRPARWGDVPANVGQWWQIFWQRVLHPFRTWGDRARWRMQALQDMAGPLAAAAQQNQSAQRLRSRWWDPLLLSILHYVTTRPRRDLVRGVPALLSLVLFVGAVLLVSGLRPSATRYTNLLASAELAMSNRDYPKALIAYERMLQVGHVDPGTQFALARCLAAMGEYQRAVQLLYALAPDDALGYIPAHRVRAYLLMQSPQATADDLALARRHLERVLAANPDDDEAHGLLASLLLRQKDVTGARNEFVQNADNRPDMALNAAMLSRELGDAPAVAANAAIAVVYYQAALKQADQEVPATTVLSLAQALCLQNKYRSAISTLESYLDKSDRDRLVKGILQICDVWQQEIDRRHGPEDLDRLYIAKTVLTYQPQAHLWQLRLLDLASEKSLVRPSAIKVLEQLAHDQTAGAEVCFFLGMEALHREDYPTARDYLERSYKILPGHAATANNLACVLLEGPAPDPARALALATEAVQAAPDNPLFHETRGEALVALARWQEAVVELEGALPGLEDRHAAHQALATAYEKLGQSDKAQQHKMLALTDKRN